MHPWQQSIATHTTAAKQAVSAIRDGEFVWCHSMGATPYVLLGGLVEHARERRDIQLMQLHTEHSEMLTRPDMQGHIKNRCFFVSGCTRKTVNEGRDEFVPIFLSEIPKLFRRGEQRVDTALIQVSPPDAHGNCSLGISVEATRAAVEVAGRVIAQINPEMPRVHGESFVHYSRFDAMIEVQSPLPEIHPSEPGEVERQIGENVASLIRDGDCLQMGIGDIPNAVLKFLAGHKDLGIHSEMFSDGLIDLYNAGAISNSKKRKYPGRIVATFVLGTRRLYDFVDDNPDVVLLDTEYVNDSMIIRQNNNVVAINSALQVDLTGQVCADSIGPQIYSGVGGQVDFIRGAALSEGGRAIIAMPATAAGGTISRISAALTLGAGVVTTRAHTHYVITEYGIANLRGKSLQERARALIAIAAPQFREPLAREVRGLWGYSL
ncbi:MAG: 4-hydroxybutyrate CoA-transferase [Gammaproteobacteria bacterium BRH_c0]|nr:MAG: 4-hydroxybutyrate CoA-transferase [Gammaproteobacteria bacterium BRH_c0]